MLLYINSYSPRKVLYEFITSNLSAPHWLFIWLWSILMIKTPAFAACSCNCLLSTCRSMINRRLLWKQRCICFYFTGYYTFTTFYFVSSCWTILGLVLWYTAFPPSAGFLTEKCAYVCVCYVPKGENHLQAVLSDLRSQWECMPAVYGDRAWPQLKT